MELKPSARLPERLRTIVAQLTGKREAAARAAFALPFFLLCAGGALRAQAQLTPSQRAQIDGASSAAAVTDEIGRRVDVPAKARRIVSLAPNLTEIVFALGEGDHLAGDTDFCDYPAAATQKPRVGGPVNPNLEQIVALAPDMILATKAINRRETVEALARLGLPVYVTDPHSVDEMISSVEHIGNALRAETTATTLAQGLRARLSDLDRRLAGINAPRVLFVVWTDPLISIGNGTFLADAMRRAGARSVVDTSAEWPRVNLEEMVRLQPEYVVFASAQAAETRQEIEALRTRPGWRDLEALRRGKVVIISDAINRPAPRMLDAIEQLARALHPDVFSSAEKWPRSSPRLADNVEEVCACAR